MKITTKKLLLTASIATALTFTGCTQDQENLALAGAGVAAVAVAASHADGSSKEKYYHHGQNYGENRNYSYRDGVRAGCNSARGQWDRNYNRFNYDNDYKYGWEHGKRQCSNNRYAN